MEPMSFGDPTASRDEQLAALLAAPPPRIVPSELRRAAAKQAAPLFGIILGCFFALVGLFVVRMTEPWNLYHDWQLSTGSSATATGRVTAVTATNTSTNHIRVMRYDFTFQTADGQPETGICFTTGRRWNPNDKVRVRYLPANPALCCIDGARQTAGGWFSLMFLIFPVAGVGVVAGLILSRRRALDLLERGVVGEALVTAVEQTMTQVNKRYVYKITLQRTDTPDGGALTMRSSQPSVVAFAQDRKASQQPVFVLYDPLKPRRTLLPETL
jgi:hypothetical protein